MTDKLWFFSPYFPSNSIKEAKVVKETGAFFIVEQNQFSSCEQVKIRKDNMMTLTYSQKYFLTREEAVEDAVKFYTRRIAAQKEKINEINKDIDAYKRLLKDDFGVEVE